MQCSVIPTWNPRIISDFSRHPASSVIWQNVKLLSLDDGGSGDCIILLLFSRSSVGKESACSAGDLGLIPGSGRFPGEGNGNPLQYSCLENPKDREARQATVHGVVRAGHNLAAKPNSFSSSMLFLKFKPSFCLLEQLKGLSNNPLHFHTSHL